MQGVEWNLIFGFNTPIIEIFLRGTFTYLMIFFLLRVVLKRESSGMGVNDMLVVVLIADAAQNGMAGGYHSVFEGIFLVSVILFWAHAIDWLVFKYKFFERVLRKKPLLLIDRGRVMRDNLHHELISVSELHAQLRQLGVDHISKVKRAFMEDNGAISVIPFESPAAPLKPKSAQIPGSSR